MSAIRLNVEPAILQGLRDLLDEQNARTAAEPGAPRVHMAQDAQDLRRAALVMAQAFVRNRDKGWLAWLRPPEVARIHAGQFEPGERKIARVIAYLLRAALPAGGVVTLETAQEGGGPQKGPRIVRGASLRNFPTAAVHRPSRLHELVFGGYAALRAYGLARSLAADKAAKELKAATEAMRERLGIPKRCVRGGMLCVHPDHEQKHVASRLSRPLLRLADQQALFYLLESSNPERNDTRVFNKFGFERTGEFLYGVSGLNSVGPYVITLMARRPAGR